MRTGRNSANDIVPLVPSVLLLLWLLLLFTAFCTISAMARFRELTLGSVMYAGSCNKQKCINNIV